MPDTVNAAKNPDLATLERAVNNRFDQQRIAGVGKINGVSIDRLPTDNSLNIAIVRGTSKGDVLCFFDGSDWLFADDYTVVS